MSSRPFANPAHPVEVKPDVKYWDNLAIAVALGVLIVSLRLWWLLTYKRKEQS